MNIISKAAISLAAMAALLLTGTTATAQSRRERKAYEAAVEKGTAEALRKYLTRYPEGYYAADVGKMLDTLLNISPITGKDAEKMLKSLIRCSDEQKVKAIGIRENGIDFIIGFLNKEFSDRDGILLLFTEKKDGFWQPPVQRRIGKYTLSEKDIFTYPSGELKCLSLDDGKHILLNYRNMDQTDFTCEYVETLIRCSDFDATNVIFRGHMMEGNKIEGRCPEMMGENDRNDKLLYLLERIRNNDKLVTISDADARSDRAIEWWMENNPEAVTKSKTIRFGVLPEDCSIVGEFEKYDGKEISADYSAALMEFRGYSIVCAKNKNKNHILVWCEPLCKDRTRDRNLNTIYFEKGATLALFYYQGRNAFKYKINLNTKSISR